MSKFRKPFVYQIEKLKHLVECAVWQRCIEKDLGNE